MDKKIIDSINAKLTRYLYIKWDMCMSRKEYESISNSLKIETIELKMENLNSSCLYSYLDTFGYAILTY